MKRVALFEVFPCTILSTDSPYTSRILSSIRNIDARSIPMHPHYRASRDYMLNLYLQYRPIYFSLMPFACIANGNSKFPSR